MRLYDHLFMKPDPNEVEEGQSYMTNLNPDSLTVLLAEMPATEAELRSRMAAGH